jgi:hypothetical protein
MTPIGGVPTGLPGRDRDRLRASKTSAPARCPIHILCSAIIIASACGALLLLIWDLDRGLDLTDESTLLYFYRHPDAFLERIYQHHFRLVSALIPSSWDHVLAYRWIKLLSLLAATAMFAVVCAQWIARRLGPLADYSLDPLTLFFFLSIGTLLSYCHGSQTLSYNDLVTIALLAVATAGFALDPAAQGAVSHRKRFLVSCAVGCILLMTFFVKWPSAILLLCYYLLFAGVVASERRPRALLASFLGTICGTLLAAFVMTDLGIGGVFSFAHLDTALSDPANLGPHRDIAALLAMYAQTSVSRLVALLRSPPALALVALPVIAVLARVYLQDGRTRRIVLWALVLIAAVMIASVRDLPSWEMRDVQWFDRFHVAELQVFAAALAWLAAWACLPVISPAMPRAALVVVLAATGLIAALPAVGAIGTNNPPLTQFIRHMAPLFAAMAMTAALLGAAARWPPLSFVAGAAIAAITTAQLAVVVLLHPYRLVGPAAEQTVKLTAPPHLAGLKVDAATYAFIGDLLAAASRAVGDTTGMPMLAMFDIPGVVYILDGIAIGFPWFPAGDDEVTCDRIQADPASRSGARLIALDRDELPPRIIECLKRAGIDLTSFVEVARIPLPYGGRPGRSLRLLVPRQPAP